MNPHYIDLITYAKARPLYPSGIYEVLKLKHAKIPRVLDLGSGTGLSVLSLAQKYTHLDVTVVEPERDLLEFCQTEIKQKTALNARAICEPVTDALYATHSLLDFDLIQIASAWHWFHGQVSGETLAASLASNGLLFIHEYQFPKTIAHHPVNEWIRKQFNTFWKPAVQKPRGTLKELTEKIRQCPMFRELPVPRIEMRSELDADLLADFLFSQSRFIAFERTLPSENVFGYREATRTQIRALMSESREFSFHWQGFLFAKI